MNCINCFVVYALCKSLPMAWRGGTISEEFTSCAFTCSERPSKKMAGKNPAPRIPNVMYAARCKEFN